MRGRYFPCSSTHIFYIPNIFAHSLEHTLEMKFSVLEFLKLVRIDLCFFGAIGLYISGFISNDLTMWSWDYLWVFIIILFSGMGSFAINDYMDYKADAINQLTDRPLVSGTLSRRFALCFAIVSAIIVIGLSFLVELIPQILIITSTAVFYGYSLGGKKIIGVKNVLVSLSYFLVILLGSLLINVIIEPLLWYFAIMAFIVGLAGEILFDIRDVAGDSKVNVRTFANRFGKKKAAWIVVTLLGIIMIMDPIPVFVLMDTRLYRDWLFFGLILIPVVGYGIISYLLLQTQEQKRIKFLRKLIMFVMQFGTLAYLIGVLVN